MIRKYFLPVLALFGIGFAIYVVSIQSRPVPAAQPVAAPAEAPFAAYVAGTGLIEASTENIAIGTVVPGVVTDVYVGAGSTVKAGDPLFKLDDRALKAELEIRQSALKLARDQMDRLAAMPRPEEIPPAEARVQTAQAILADAKNQLELYESVADKRAVSQDDLLRRRFAVQAAESRLAEAKASLTLLKAGTWKPDLDIAQAQVAAAEAQVKAVQTDIERLTTRSPVDGQILQMKIRLGEYAPAGVLQQPLILMGQTQPLHVRVDVDENDAWRIRKGNPAIAYVRGNRDLTTRLEFVRVEPYVIPKRSLTGESTERVDTRVLQVLFRFQKNDLPVYAGQQMDVFIEAPPVGSGGGFISVSDKSGTSTKGAQP